MNAQIKNTARDWLALLRVPNLLTVPGDALTGFALAWATHSGGLADLVAAMLAGVLFYAAGLIMNDLADIERDRVERPGRPLPSGRIDRRVAKVVAGVLMGMALVTLGAHGWSMLIAGIALGGLILFYNYQARRYRWLGAGVMGLCRAASVGLGVAAGAPSALVAPLTVGIMIWWALYIAAVSWLAAREMERGAYGAERWLPLAVIFIGATWLLLSVDGIASQTMVRSGAAFGFAGIIAWQCAMRLRLNEAKFHPPMIGWLISVIIPLQAGVLVLFSREPWMLLAALLLLICWWVNRLLAKSFAPS